MRHSKWCRKDRSNWAVENLSVAIPAPSGKADSLTWMKQTNLAPAKIFAMIQLLWVRVLPRTGCQVTLALHIHPSEAEERHFRLGKRVSVIFWHQNRSSWKLHYRINSWLVLVLNTQRKGPPQVASRPFPFTSNSASHTFHQKSFSPSFIEYSFIQSMNYKHN